MPTMTPEYLAQCRHNAAKSERTRRKMTHDRDFRELAEENEKLRKELAELKAKPSKR